MRRGLTAGSAAGVLLVGIVYGSWWSAHWSAADFASYWEMWRMALAGLNPYAAGSYCAWLAAESAVSCVGPPGPPPTVLLFSPLGLLPVDVAGILFVGVGVALAVWSLSAVLDETMPWWESALWGFVLVAGDAGFLALGHGQWSFYVAAVWCAGYRWPSMRWLSVTVAAVKPHVAGGMALVYRGKALIACVLVGIIPTWWLWREWLTGLVSSGWTSGYAASLWVTLGRGAGAAVAVVVVALVWRVSRDRWLTVPAVWLALGPYGRGYDYVVLVPILAAVSARYGRRWSMFAAVALLTAMAISAEAARVLGGGVSRDERWSVAIPLVVTAVAVLSERKGPRFVSVARGREFRSVSGQ